MLPNSLTRLDLKSAQKRWLNLHQLAGDLKCGFSVGACFTSQTSSWSGSTPAFPQAGIQRRPRTAIRKIAAPSFCRGLATPFRKGFASH